MGDPKADEENEVLKNEQDMQVGHGSRGDVTLLPTLVVNDIQYRVKLERSAVVKVVCIGFKETTDPPVCLSLDLETNECLKSNGGCWQDVNSNITACKGATSVQENESIGEQCQKRPPLKKLIKKKIQVKTFEYFVSFCCSKDSVNHFCFRMNLKMCQLGTFV